MTVGFIVLAHTQPTSLGALVHELRPNPVFVHIDKNVAQSDFIESALLTRFPSVYVNPRPRCLHWGGYSILQAMMETLEIAIERTDEAVHHFAFLSGECFPLRPVSEFADYLMNADRPVLCRGVSLDGKREMGRRRIDQLHWLDGRIGHFKKTKSKILGSLVRRCMFMATFLYARSVPDIQHACGSQWASVPRSLALELVAFYRKGGFEYLRQSFAPDEIAIPTYVYNSNWRHQTTVAALESASGHKVSSFSNYHWLKSSMGGYVDENDLPLALKSNQFFLRKVPPNSESNMRNIITSTWSAGQP